MTNWLHKHQIPVALDKELVQQLLDGLLRGAKGKALKAFIDINGSYVIESKELRVVIEGSAKGKGIGFILIHNNKQYSQITEEMLVEMGLASLAEQVIRELREKYSPVFHSLADNIIVFGRAYGSTDTP